MTGWCLIGGSSGSALIDDTAEECRLVDLARRVVKCQLLSLALAPRGQLAWATGLKGLQPPTTRAIVTSDMSIPRSWALIGSAQRLAM
jgi:hypothetical protein